MKQLQKQNSSFSELKEVADFATHIAGASEFLPKEFRGNPAAITAALLTGKEIGLTPMVSLRSFHVVNGKVGVNYDAQVGLLKRHGYDVRWPKSTNEIAEVSIWKNGIELISMPYTIQDAQRAGLTGKPVWKAHPATMLRARAVSNAARAVAGDIFCGFYSDDEIEEIRDKSEPRNITPKTAKTGSEAALAALDAAECTDEGEEAVVDNLEPTQADYFADSIDEAPTLEVLNEIGAKIKDSDLSDSDKSKLKICFKSKKDGFMSAVA